jgi:hypothetical protein
MIEFLFLILVFKTGVKLEFQICNWTDILWQVFLLLNLFLAKLVIRVSERNVRVEGRFF